MRKLVVTFLLACLLSPSLASAQQPSQAEAERERKAFVGKMKIISGAALVAIGLLKVMNSSTTGDISQGGVVHEETFTSGVGVAMGLGAAGAGGWLVWSGMRDRAASKRPQVGIVISKKTVAVGFRKSW